MRHLIDRDERDVEDMRKDDTPIVAEIHRTKRGHGVRIGGARSQDNATTGLSGLNEGKFGDTQSTHDRTAENPR